MIDLLVYQKFISFFSQVFLEVALASKVRGNQIVLLKNGTEFRHEYFTIFQGSGWPSFPKRATERSEVGEKSCRLVINSN